MITVQNLSKIFKTPIKTNNSLRDLFMKKYEDKKAVDNISFNIEENELVGFIGPNGAGKTTTLKMLSGILFPTSGSISILGHTPFEKKYSFLKKISFVMGQKNQLLWELTPYDSFIMNKEIYDINNIEFKKTLEELVESLHCKEFLYQPVKTLSLGQRMRMELISALLHKPKVLFLDEPTIGLDIFAQTTIVNFITQYQNNNKSTIILTSHYMQDVERMAKRVIMIDHGSIIYDGLLKDLVNKYSQQKNINITLSKTLSDNFVFPETIKGEYLHPQLKLTTKKEDIASVLSYILKQVDFSDVTIENEPIEEVIKKIFSASKKTKNP